jgi:protein involved in polysaccharide export with SLBB domain
MHFPEIGPLHGDIYSIFCHGTQKIPLVCSSFGRFNFWLSRVKVQLLQILGRAEIMKTTKQIQCFRLVLVFFVLSACHPVVYNTVPLGSPGTIVPPVQEQYKISVGDKLSIKLFYNPELNQEVVVRPDGRISLQLVNDINVLGLSPAKVSEVLTENYAKYLAQPPEVSVILTATGGMKIFVGGEVGATGVKDLTGPTTVLGAIVLAGGFKDTSDRNQVVLVRKDENNKPIYVKLDIEKAMKGIDPSQDVYVQAYDVILIPRTGIADVNVWIDQYLGRTLSLVSPFAFYFLYR